MYQENLKNENIYFITKEKNASPVYWMVGILLSNKIKISKIELQNKLKRLGIDSRSFFMSMNNQPCFKKFKSKFITKNSNTLWNRGIYLPSSHDLNEKKIKFICKKVLASIA